MRTKKMKKALAVLMAATMAMGMSVNAFAADTTAESGSGSATGEGTYEGHVDQKTIVVTLPTDDDSTTFKYIMDPEGLIAKTDGAAYDSGYTFAEGANVYFATSTGNYTDTSATLEVVNKSTHAIGVTLEASVSDDTALTMNTTGTFDGTDKELYLALVTLPGITGETKTAVQKASSATEVKLEVAGNADNFEVTYDSDASEYTFAAKSGVAKENWNSFQFCLTGKCNTAATWEDTDVAPEVTVTWSFELITDTNKGDYTDVAENKVAYVADKDPSVADAAVLEAGKVATLTVDLGNGTKAATAITAVTWSGTTTKWLTFDATANTVSITDTSTVDWMLENLDGTNNKITITFDNNFSLDVVLTAKSAS